MNTVSAGSFGVRIPPLIKRNIVLFALAQSFTGAGMSFFFGLGPLMVISLTGSAALAGISVGFVGISRIFVSYPVGKITDAFGRRPGILFGLILAITGALITGASMPYGSAVILALGLLVFAMGMSAAQQLRVAATDMFPPSHRARALGYLGLGSLAGLVVSPLLITLSESLAPRLGQDPLTLPWLFLPGLIVPSMMLVFFVRPDPKEIGMHLDRYYPGYVMARRSAPGERPPFRATTLLRNPRIRLAIVSNCAAQGNMSIVMVLTSLVLSHHGYSLTAIGWSHMFHSAGMFAFTIPLGWLADRLGRERVMYPGVGVAVVGASLVALTASVYSVTLGTFLVGLGWAAANVSATALIADQVQTQERGRAIGVNETASGMTALAMALVTGPLVEYGGLSATGLAAAFVAVVPFALWSVERARARIEAASLRN